VAHVVYIGCYATGGLITTLGFISLGSIRLFTTSNAYFAIRKGDLTLHQGLMIYSYAACFAAATLCIWLPLLTVAYGDLVPAYRVWAWLCWVPSIAFAYFLCTQKGTQRNLIVCIRKVLGRQGYC